MTDSAIGKYLAYSGLVIVLAYASLRYLGNWQVRQSKGRRMRVLEGLHVGRDRQILLVAVGRELLVLGSSANGVTLVHRLSEEVATDMLAEQEQAAAAQPPLPGPFADLFGPARSGSAPSSPGPVGSAPSGSVLESSIRASLGKMRNLLRKESGDQSDKWGPL